MKKLALLAAFTFAAGVAVADEKPAAPQAPAAADKAAGHDHAAHAAKHKTHDVEAEVVSVDVEKKTLTLKGDPENKTVPVEGKAVAALKTVKAGSMYTLTCKDDEAGNHVAVLALKPVDSKTPTAKK